MPPNIKENNVAGVKRMNTPQLTHRLVHETTDMGVENQRVLAQILEDFEVHGCDPAKEAAHAKLMQLEQEKISHRQKAQQEFEASDENRYPLTLKQIAALEEEEKKRKEEEERIKIEKAKELEKAQVLARQAGLLKEDVRRNSNGSDCSHSSWYFDGVIAVCNYCGEREVPSPVKMTPEQIAINIANASKVKRAEEMEPFTL